MPKEFLIGLKNLPDSLTEEVRRFTGDFTVPIIVDDVPLGSGTLVQIDRHAGILTAEHVVNHPKLKDLQLTYTGFPERKLLTSVAEFPHSLSITTNALRIIKTTRSSDEYGPDLAFIKLPEGGMLAELRAKKSFCNLTRQPGTSIAEALEDKGFMCFCGYPRSRDYRGRAELGFAETRGLYGYAFITGADKHEVRSGWDYFELGVSHKEIESMGSSFGGVSGGGLWHFTLGRRRGEKPGREKLIRCTFAGVAFYQEDHGVGSRFFVRAHGPRSVYDTFIDVVRSQL